MARKPLRGTLASTVLEYGTGALNIDGTRIGTTKDIPASPSRMEDTRTHGQYGPTPTDTDGWRRDVGRWPANIVLTDAIFDGGVDGVVGGGPASPGTAAGVKGSSGFVDGYDGEYTTPYGDTGTYSRFFLVPKEARSGREPLITGQLPERIKASYSGGVNGTSPRDDNFRTKGTRANTHPTVKPLELMRHLVRLVTPPGGTVLDPFLGSGTTAIACEMEGFAWIGIEKEPEYVEIAKARLNGVQRGLGLDVGAPIRKPPKTHPDLSKHQPKVQNGESSMFKWRGFDNRSEDEVPA